MLSYFGDIKVRISFEFVPLQQTMLLNLCECLWSLLNEKYEIFDHTSEFFILIINLPTQVFPQDILLHRNRKSALEQAPYSIGLTLCDLSCL